MIDGEQQPTEQGPASAGALPAVNVPLAGSIHPATAGSGAASPHSTQPDRSTGIRQSSGCFMRWWVSRPRSELNGLSQCG
ncbi:hypothetical protein, partial [Streptomyces sp. MBT51]|uniref:hypothetical protein n=1 Tax=Streptomyces sp. MBT51 TaxID=2800408 RepID=UPI001F1B185A